MAHRRRLAALAMVGAMAGSALAAPTGAASGEPGELVEIAGDAVYLSPNGDHVRDRGTVHFTLSRPARVVVIVRGYDGEVVPPVRLGSQDAGDHQWRWNGLDLDSRPLPDGQYFLDLVATRGSATLTVSRLAVRGRTTDARGWERTQTNEVIEIVTA